MCIEQDVLLAAIQGRLASEVMAQVGAHLKGCASCRERSRQLARAREGVPAARTPSAPPAPSPTTNAEHSGVLQLSLGSFIGRYSIINLIGIGGMGAVYSAYDPELDRRIALKVLRNDLGSESARARLLREAQAIARLSHPNVISVHDVGTTAAGVFMAMEFVNGGTLATWLREKQRRWQEIVEMFGHAGKGLAAAHDAGLTHRDFKPENVLVDREGRVRVTDFGLARSNATPEPTLAALVDPEEELEDSGRIRLSSPLTVGEMLIGTPAYMAPEQLWGKQADPRSDQFSFCVALYEELYHQRPFAGATVAELRQQIEQGRIIPPPKSPQVPSWIFRVLARGLSKSPEDRYSSMNALLSTLRANPATILRRRLAIAGIVALFAGCALGLYAFTRRLTDASCEAAVQGLAGIWDSNQKSAIHRSFTSTGKGFAEDAWNGTERALDAYAAAWVKSRTRACQAVQSRKELADVAALRTLCLDQRLVEFHALSEQLAHADAEIVGKAFNAGGFLSPVGDCEDTSGLAARFKSPADPVSRIRVQQIRATLVEGKVRLQAGNYREGLQLVLSEVAKARAIGYRPLLAEAITLQGKLEDESGDSKSAESTLRNGHRLAIEEGHDRVSVETANLLLYVDATKLGRPEEAHIWAEEASGHLAHLGGDSSLEAELWANWGSLLSEEAKYEDAKKMLLKSLAIREKLNGHNSPNVANLLNKIAGIEYAQGQYQEASAQMREAVKIWTQSVGPLHPELGAAMGNFAVLLSSQDKFDEANVFYRESLSILEHESGSSHPKLAGPLINLAESEIRQGRYPEAAALLERARKIREKALGAESPKMASVLDTLGTLAARQRRYREALEYHQRALSLRQKSTSTPDHPSLAGSWQGLANAYAGLGNYLEAVRYMSRALAIREDKLGPLHPWTGFVHQDYGRLMLDMQKPTEALAHYQSALDISAKTVSQESLQVGERLAGLGITYLKLGQAGKALPLLERSYVIGSSGPLDSHDLAERQLALAKALWRTHQEPDRASRLAAQARVGFESGVAVRFKQ